ncbi:MAG: isoprenyl transferase [Bacteroidia bacterium]|nr:isoprenyl transferase [Bacteroidia bacterium]
MILDELKKNYIPRHVAVIMDGNGRWAELHGNDRIFGHTQGVDAVRSVVEGAGESGVEYLTLYAFSTENWDRPKDEVNALMSLLVHAIVQETDNLNEKNVKMLAIGNLASLPPDVQLKLSEAVQSTSSNTGLNLILALSYSGRWEILEAVKKIVCKAKNGEVSENQINENMFASHLSTVGIPDPELLIRTSGEYRISNFLLWQIAYSEFYFTPILWPDFRKENLFEAIGDFQRRERRFGKTSEQIRS